MQTRNLGKYEPGKYVVSKWKFESKFTNTHPDLNLKKKVFKEINQINLKIIKKLNFSTNKSPTILRSIEISNRFYLYISKISYKQVQKVGSLFGIFQNNTRKILFEKA